MSKLRFYIDTIGNDDEAYRSAMRKACDLADKDDEVKKVVILISTKQNTGWFDRLYGDKIVKELFVGTRFKDCKPRYKFETLQTYKDSLIPSEVVITCGLRAEDVFRIDDYYSVKCIIAIPWLREDMEKWARTWNPVELRGNQNAIDPFPKPTCIVQKAMDDLTSMINITTGINNPVDNKLAKTYIRALHRYEDSFDADIVGAYLATELGWFTRHIKDVEQLINTLNAGGYFQGGDKTGLQDYYKPWKKECSDQ